MAIVYWYDVTVSIRTLTAGPRAAGSGFTEATELLGEKGACQAGTGGGRPAIRGRPQRSRRKRKVSFVCFLSETRET